LSFALQTEGVNQFKYQELGMMLPFAIAWFTQTPEKDSAQCNGLPCSDLSIACSLTWYTSLRHRRLPYSLDHKQTKQLHHRFTFHDRAEGYLFSVKCFEWLPTSKDISTKHDIRQNLEACEGGHSQKVVSLCFAFPEICSAIVKHPCPYLSQLICGNVVLLQTRLAIRISKY
jgi:hypothetical protein